jgi:uncharacterized membrane protein YdcZ (DUF606 family)
MLRNTQQAKMVERFISYLTGTLLLAIAIASGEPWLSGTMAARRSWVTWTGGIFGAVTCAFRKEQM